MTTNIYNIQGASGAVVVERRDRRSASRELTQTERRQIARAYEATVRPSASDIPILEAWLARKRAS